MKKFLYWPGLVAIGYLLFELYNFLWPCRDGLFLGGCRFGQMFIRFFLSVSLLFYMVMFTIYFSIQKTRKKRLDAWLCFLFGPLSLFLTFVDAYGLKPSIFWFLAPLFLFRF